MVTDKINREGGNSSGSGAQASSEPRASAPEDRLSHAGAIAPATPPDRSEKLCVELSSFEDVIAGELLNSAVRFFSLHRVERSRMDGPEGNLSSLSQKFRSPTGLNPRHSRAQPAARAEGGRAGA
jgi:hypothetical protein